MARKVTLRAFENPVPAPASPAAAPAKKSRKRRKSGATSTKKRTTPMAKKKRTPAKAKKGRKLTAAQKRAKKAARTRRANLQLALAAKAKASRKRRAKKNPVALSNPRKRRKSTRRAKSPVGRMMILSAAKPTRKRRKSRRNPVALSNPRKRRRSRKYAVAPKRRRRTRKYAAAPKRRRRTRKNPVALSNPRKRRRSRKNPVALSNPRKRRRSRKNPVALSNPRRRKYHSRARKNPAGNVFADVMTAFFFGALGYVIMRLVRDGTSYLAGMAGLDGSVDPKKIPSNLSATDIAEYKKQHTHNELYMQAALRTIIPVILLAVTYKAVWERRAMNPRAQSIMQNMWLGAGIGATLGILEDWINVFTFGHEPVKGTGPSSIAVLKAAIRSDQRLMPGIADKHQDGSDWSGLKALEGTDTGFTPFGAVKNPVAIAGAGFTPFGAMKNAGFTPFGVSRANPVLTDRAAGSFLDDYANGYMSKKNPDDGISVSELEDELSKISNNSAGFTAFGMAKDAASAGPVMVPNKAQRNSISLEDRKGSTLDVSAGVGIDDF